MVAAGTPASADPRVKSWPLSLSIIVNGSVPLSVIHIYTSRIGSRCQELITASSGEIIEALLCIQDIREAKREVSGDRSERDGPCRAEASGIP